jgi:microcystin-dependent protein
MSRNGSGVYSVPNTFVSGNTITASGHNGNWTDVATEMTNSVAADGQTSMTGPLKAANGTVGSPAITFAADPDTGIYHIGANNLGVAVNGAKVLDVSTTGLNVTGTVKQAGFALLPVGVILPYGGSSAPSGYLFCDGSSLLRASYADLFTAIGTTYGSADGTHFTLPDLRGRVIAGKEASATRLTSTYFGGDSTALGAVGGSESHTLITAELASHSHTATDAGHTHSFTLHTNASNPGAGAQYTYIDGAPGAVTSTTASGTASITFGNTGSGTAHANVQPTIICNYIIFAGI